MSLDAGDEFLKNRVMNLPESVVAGTHNTEEGKTSVVGVISIIYLFFFFWIKEYRARQRSRHALNLDHRSNVNNATMLQ